MKKHNNNQTKIKRIKFLGEFLLAFGGKREEDGKIIMKSLKPEDKEHLTIKFTKDYMDIHETKEGKIKEYKTIEKIKIEDFINNLEQSVGFVRTEFLKSRIDLEDPKYQDYIALIPKSDEDIKNTLFIRKGKNIQIPKEVLDDPTLLNKIYTLVQLPEVRKHKFEWCLVYNSEGKQEGALYNIDGNYFLVKEQFFEGWMDRLLPLKLSR